MLMYLFRFDTMLCQINHQYKPENPVVTFQEGLTPGLRGGDVNLSGLQPAGAGKTSIHTVSGSIGIKVEKH